MAASSARRWMKGTVIEAEDAAEGIRRIVIRPERPGQPAPPGSHIDIGVRIRGLSDVRSYSVVGMGDDGESLVLGVQLARESRGGSAYMHSLGIGAQVSISQPLQNFPLTYGRPDYVLLAGGIGITALVAMASSLRERGAPTGSTTERAPGSCSRSRTSCPRSTATGWSCGSTTRAPPSTSRRWWTGARRRPSSTSAARSACWTPYAGPGWRPGSR
jgi:hypothetical protein